MIRVEQQILELSNSENYEECIGLMQRYKELSEILAIVSRATGERVVIK